MIHVGIGSGGCMMMGDRYGSLGRYPSRVTIAALIQDLPPLGSVPLQARVKPSVFTFGFDSSLHFGQDLIPLRPSGQPNACPLCGDSRFDGVSFGVDEGFDHLRCFNNPTLAAQRHRTYLSAIMRPPGTLLDYSAVS